MGYLTNYKISFIHFGKTEMPKEVDVVNALNSINPYDFEVGEMKVLSWRTSLRSLLSGMTI